MNNVHIPYNRIKSNHHILWYTFMTIVMFCLIYQFRLTIFGLPEQLHSSRVAAIVLYVVFLFKLNGFHSYAYTEDKKAIRYYKGIIFVHVCIFIYMLILYLCIGVIEGTPMMVVLLNFFFITLIPIYLCSKIFDDLDDFFFIILAATLLQTIIIWIATIYSNVGTAIDYIFNDIEYYELTRDGYAGGLGCITAPGYMRFSLGQIACFYFYVKKKDIKFFILYLVLFLTGSMIARTGLLGGIVGLLMMVVFKYRTRDLHSFLPTLLILIMGYIIAGFLLSNNDVNLFFTTRFHRMNTLMESSRDWGFFNDSFFEDYFNGETTVIPPLTTETIIGTGVPAGIAGNGIAVNVDGGWFRLYVAYGLVLAIAFYVYLFGSMLRETYSQSNLVIRHTLLLTIILLLIAEFKEWVVYSSPFILVFTDTLILATRQRMESTAITNRVI